MRFPKGVRMVVEEYTDRIERKTGVQVKWDEPYGCGSFGCVFPLADINERRVLKISTDPTEGPVVAAIMKTGLDKRLDGLARWFGVWRILTIFDPGHSSAPKGVAIEELWEETVRTNPWIPDSAEEIPRI